MKQAQDLRWKVLDSKIAFKDRWLTVRADSCQMPNGNIIDPYYVIDYPNWVTVVAITEEGQVVLSRQYRHGRQVIVEELPSGTAEPTDDGPEMTVRRELLEETGYAFSEVYEVATISPNPSNHSNHCTCFLALGGKQVDEQHLDPAEQIDVILIDIPEFLERLHQNAFLQAMHVTCAFYALQKLREIRPELLPR